MMKSVCAATILAIAAGASAAPFAALSYEAGGGLPGIVGAGLTVNGGGFFTSDGAGNNVFGATAASMSLGNEFQFDSHWAMDGFGPSARNRSGTAAFMAGNSTATTTFYGDYGAPGTAAANYDELEGPTFNAGGAGYISGSGSHVGDPNGALADPITGTPENAARAGIAVSPPPVFSHFAPNVGGGRSAFDGIFVGRFTIQNGATLSGGMLFNTVDPLSPTGFSGAVLALGGPGVPVGTTNGLQVLGLRSYRVTTVDLVNGSASTSDGIDDGNAYGLADVYDLWVQVIPTPGTLALVGLSGIAAIRRRRA